MIRQTDFADLNNIRLILIENRFQGMSLFVCKNMQ